MLDLPGIIEGAKDGKGRGRQVGAACCLREWGGGGVHAADSAGLNPSF